jgi:hypothetical protein
MHAQGLKPETRIDELSDYAFLIDGQKNLQKELRDCYLNDGISIGRRISAIINQKQRLRIQVLKPAPQPKAFSVVDALEELRRDE